MPIKPWNKKEIRRSMARNKRYEGASMCFPPRDDEKIEELESKINNLGVPDTVLEREKQFAMGKHLPLSLP